MTKKRPTDPIFLSVDVMNAVTALERVLKEDYMPAVKDELLRAIDEKVAQLAADEERKLYARGPLIEVQSVQHPILERLAACAAGDRKAYVLLKAPRNAWVTGKVTRTRSRRCAPVWTRRFAATSSRAASARYAPIAFRALALLSYGAWSRERGSEDGHCGAADRGGAGRWSRSRSMDRSAVTAGWRSEARARLRRLAMVSPATESDLRRALDALDAVLALHAPRVVSEYRTICQHCWNPEDLIPVAWPCPTVRAIEGTDGAP